MENMMGKQIAISKNCAEYFFSEKEDVTGYGYCETDSYIVFTEIKNGSDEGKIVAMHKQTLERKEIDMKTFATEMFHAKENATLKFSENYCQKIFDEKRITSVGDKIYFFTNTGFILHHSEALCCYNLENGKHNIVSLDPKTKINDTEQKEFSLPCDVPLLEHPFLNARHLTAIGDKLIYISNDNNIVLMTIKDDAESESQIITPSDDYDLCLDCGLAAYDGNLYFVQEALSGIGDGREEIKSGYQIVKYNLAEKEFSTASDIFFAYEPLERISEVVKFHAYKNYLCVVVAWNFPVCTTGEYDGYEGYCIDVSHENATISGVYFWQSHIYQMEFFGRYVIYNNADKNYTIYKHDFINDKRHPLVNNCGSTEKASLIDKLTFGAGEYQHPHEYLLLGNWLKCKSRFAEGLIDLEETAEESYEPNIVEEIIDTIAEILPF